MKKKSAYPDAAADATAHQGHAAKLSGKMEKSVTPSSVPAARLIKAHRGLCPRFSDVLMEPPANAKA